MLTEDHRKKSEQNSLIPCTSRHGRISQSSPPCPPCTRVVSTTETMAHKSSLSVESCTTCIACFFSEAVTPTCPPRVVGSSHGYSLGHPLPPKREIAQRTMPCTKAASHGGELFPLQACWPCREGFCPAFIFPSKGHWKPLFPWAPRQLQVGPSAFASLAWESGSCSQV